MRRRAFLAATATAALVSPRAALAQTQAEDEAGLLAAAIELEQLAGFVYDAALAAGLAVGGRLEETVRALREHELRHERALSSSLEALGGRIPRPPADAAEADERLERLGVPGRVASMTSRHAFLELAEDLELRQVGAYVDAVGKLEDVRLIQTCASILASEGAHLVVIRDALGGEQLVKALEPGRR